MSPAMTIISSSSFWLSMANWMSFTAPKRVSLVLVPSSTTVIFWGLVFAQWAKWWANRWLEITTYSSINPAVSRSSTSQSRIVFSCTLSKGLGKFSVKGYSRVAYPAAKIKHFISFPLHRRFGRYVRRIYQSDRRISLSTPA